MAVLPTRLLVMVFFFSAAFMLQVNAGLKARQCNGGMEFTYCGTACPKECGKEEPMICTMQCVEGCFCPHSQSIWDPIAGKCVADYSDCELER